MNTPKPLNPIQELLQGIDRHLSTHKDKFDQIWRYRFWLLLGVLSTLLMPVLIDNSGTRSGYDVCEPAVFHYNMMGVAISKSWAVNPFAALVYLWIAYATYHAFLGQRPRWDGPIFLLILLLALSWPLTFILAAKLFVPGNSIVWFAQAPAWGWWFLISLITLITAATRTQDLRIAQSEMGSSESGGPGALLSVALSATILLSGCGRSSQVSEDPRFNSNPNTLSIRELAVVGHWKGTRTYHDQPDGTTEWIFFSNRTATNRTFNSDGTPHIDKVRWCVDEDTLFLDDGAGDPIPAHIFELGPHLIFGNPGHNSNDVTKVVDP